MKMRNLHPFKYINQRIRALHWSLIFGCLLTSLFYSEGFGQTFVANHGQLKVSGNRIVDKDNKPITLHGMSMYAWAQQGLQYYTAANVTRIIQEWKCTVIRVPILPGRVNSQTNQVKKVVDACIANGVYAIIDWHSMDSAQAPAASEFFKSMATLYGNTPNVMYETWNEPVRETWANIKTYHETVIAAIRSIDPDNIIICGTPFYDQRPSQAAADPIKTSTNIAYSLHFYAATHKQVVRDNATAALSNGIALFATEYGTAEANGNGAIDEAETKTWWKFMDANGIGSTNWSVSALTETTAIFNLGTSPSDWTNADLKPTGVLVKAYIISQYQGVGVIKGKHKPAQHDIGLGARFSILGDASQSTNIFTLKGTRITSHLTGTKAANGVYAVEGNGNNRALNVNVIH